MEIKVATAIEELLDRRETVTLVGIGSIKLESLSAKISEDKKTIAPPQVKLGFYEVQTENEPLRKYLMYQYKLTKKEANKAIKKYSQSVLNSLANYGEVKLEGIATISTSEGKYELKAIDSFKAKYYEGLPVLPISKLGDSSTTEPIKETPQPKPATQKPAIQNQSSPAVAKREETVRKEDLKLAKPAIPPSPPRPKEIKDSDTKTAAASASSKMSSTADKVLKATGVSAAAGALGKTASSIKETAASGIKTEKPMNLNEKLALKNKSATTATASSVKSTTPKTTIATTKPKSRYELPPQRTPVSIPPKKESFGCLGPFLGLLGLLLFAFLIWKGISCIMNTDTPKLAATEKLSDAAENLAEKAGETMDDATAKIGAAKDEIVTAAEETAGKVSEAVSDVVEQETDSYPQGISETCIIIIGSFSNYQNVNAAERKLKDRGYTVYVEEYGPYTRVGFEFDCKGKNLQAYIRDIRRSIESKAWYLQPKLHVDY